MGTLKTENVDFSKDISRWWKHRVFCPINSDSDFLLTTERTFLFGFNQAQVTEL